MEDSSCCETLSQGFSELFASQRDLRLCHASRRQPPQPAQLQDASDVDGVAAWASVRRGKTLLKWSLKTDCEVVTGAPMLSRGCCVLLFLYASFPSPNYSTSHDITEQSGDVLVV